MPVTSEVVRSPDRSGKRGRAARGRAAEVVVDAAVTWVVESRRAWTENMMEAPRKAASSRF